MWYILFVNREKLTLGDCGNTDMSARSSAICAKENACEWINEKTRWDGEPTTATKCECIRCQQCVFDLKTNVCSARSDGQAAEYEEDGFEYTGDSQSKKLHKNYYKQKKKVTLDQVMRQACNSKRFKEQDGFSVDTCYKGMQAFVKTLKRDYNAKDKDLIPLIKCLMQYDHSCMINSINFLPPKLRKIVLEAYRRNPKERAKDHIMLTRMIATGRSKLP